LRHPFRIFLTVFVILLLTGEGRAELIIETSSGSLVSGDVLLHAVAEGKEIDLISPFDLLALEQEYGPTGAVKLEVIHGNERLHVASPAPPWKLAVRPRLDSTILGLHEEARIQKERGNIAQAAVLWREAASNTADNLVAAWLSFLSAQSFAETRDVDASMAQYVRAFDLAGRAGHTEGKIQILIAEATSLRGAGRTAESEKAIRGAHELRSRSPRRRLSYAVTLHLMAVAAYERGALEETLGLIGEAARIREQFAPDSVVLAQSLTVLGNVASDLGDKETAEPSYRKALEILRKVAPGSVDLATVLHSIGTLLSERGNLDESDSYLNEALIIRSKLHPQSLDTAISYHNLAINQTERGHLEDAELLLHKALKIHEELRTETLPYAATLNELGYIADERRNLEEAEGYYKKALAMVEKIAPNSLEMAGYLQNLGVIASVRGEFDQAELYHKRAHEIRMKIAPNGPDIWMSWDNLATAARDRGDFKAAEELYRKSLTAAETSVPNTLQHALALNNLGSLLAERKQFDAAKQYGQKALEIREKLAPGSLAVADAHQNLAQLAFDTGKYDEAEAGFRRALALRHPIAPGSFEEAILLHQLGLLLRKKGDLQGAVDHFFRAIEALEAQKARLGGSHDVQSGFTAEYADFYRDLIDLLIELGDTARAFGVSERSRARSLLAMLAEREAIASSEIPPALAQRRIEVDREYEKTQALLGEVNPSDEPDAFSKLSQNLISIRKARDDLAEEIRGRSPRFAALHYPQPLDLASTRSALDPGTVMLSYVIGESRTILFVIQPAVPFATSLPAATAFFINVGAQDLRRRVAQFSALLTRPRNESGAWGTDAEEMFQLLLGQAEPWIAKASRILISPDGPLHDLPFAALKRNRHQLVAQWKPIHVAVSATLAAELQKSRASARSSKTELVAFGDPHYLSAPSAGRSTTQAVRGFSLEPLPSTREEVRALTALFRGKSVGYLGEDATEERAKRAAGEARYLHFACHGLLNEAVPLDSALVLSIPTENRKETENGILQAWEIFDSVRTSADLVTLSACETAQGKEVGGEGLIGLTRAFQFAGARSVVGSLWSVSDESTALLMTHFYGALKKGLPKDRALQHAQQMMIRNSRFSHPFYWAAFTLNGDWK
jgi:CHAT domain-containing protein/tetratricopeptide (TPR) repeat protein